VRALLKLATRQRLETVVFQRVLHQPACLPGFRQRDNAQQLLAK
jgi:hypothetical protein